MFHLTCNRYPSLESKQLDPVRLANQQLCLRLPLQVAIALFTNVQSKHTKKWKFTNVTTKCGDPTHNRLRREANNGGVSGGNRCNELSGDIFHKQTKTNKNWTKFNCRPFDNALALEFLRNLLFPSLAAGEDGSCEKCFSRANVKKTGRLGGVTFRNAATQSWHWDLVFARKRDGSNCLSVSSVTRCHTAYLSSLQGEH